MLRNARKWLTARFHALCVARHHSGGRTFRGGLADHVSPYERNVVVSVAGRSARSMWAALQTELQMNDSSDVLLRTLSWLRCHLWRAR